MTIYDKVTRYHSVTGKPYEAMVEKEIRCDYTGNMIEIGHDTYCSYNIDYGDGDPCFGSFDNEASLKKDFGVNLETLMSSPYTFMSNPHGTWYSEQTMMKLALDNNDLPINFEMLCRRNRIATARELLESGQIEAWQL